MIFGLVGNILFSVGMILIIGGTYIGINKYVSSQKDKLNKVLVITMYILFLVLVLGGLGFLMYIWDIGLVNYLRDLWDKVGSGILDKVGAIITTIIILVIATSINKIFKFLVNRSQNLLHTSNEKRKHTILKITSSVVNYTVKLIAILAILAVWGVNVLPALAGLGILGLVVGLGAQDLIKDIIAGFFIVFEKHFDIGDKIEVNGFKGEVIDIGLKTTRIRNWKQDVKIFNNGSVVNVINYSITESVAAVEFSIGYEEDVDQVLEILAAELPKTRETIPALIEDPTCLGVTDLGASGVNLRVTAKTLTEQHFGVERALRKEIKRILNNHGIEIPFPQLVIQNKN